MKGIICTKNALRCSKQAGCVTALNAASQAYCVLFYVFFFVTSPSPRLLFTSFIIVHFSLTFPSLYWVYSRSRRAEAGVIPLKWLIVLCFADNVIICFNREQLLITCPNEKVNIISPAWAVWARPQIGGMRERGGAAGGRERVEEAPINIYE